MLVAVNLRHVSSDNNNGIASLILLFFLSFSIARFIPQDDFDNLRTLCYDSTDVYVVCFSVVSPASFANVASR